MSVQERGTPEAETPLPSPAEILDRARGLVLHLRERAEESRRLRRVPDATMEDYDAAGLIRLAADVRAPSTAAGAH